MSKVTIDKQTITREILQPTEWTRDALPYAVCPLFSRCSFLVGVRRPKFTPL